MGGFKLEKSVLTIMLAVILFVCATPFAMADETVLLSESAMIQAMDLVQNDPNSDIVIRFDLDKSLTSEMQSDTILGDVKSRRDIPGFSPVISKLIQISASRQPVMTYEILEVQGREITSVIPESEIVQLGKPQIMGGLRVARLSIQPITTDKITGDPMVINRIKITISMSEKEGVNVLDNPVPITRTWDAFYRGVVWNYISDDAFRNGEPENYLIVTADEYEPRLQGFIGWKEAEGYRVDILRMSELPMFPSPANLKAAIQTRYSGLYPPVYVVFCGDEHVTPIFLTYDPTHPGDYADDHYYSLLAGEDNLPDIFLSRLPVEDGEELSTILNKIMRYEHEPQMENLAFYRTALMAASSLEESQVTTKEQTRERLETYCGYQTVHTYYYDWSDTKIQNLIEDIETGVSIINYRGEGWRRGWNPEHAYWFDCNKIYDINNPGLTPFITSIGCGVALFNQDDDDCWAEAFIAMGNPATSMGAVGVIGPTWNTHTTYNNWIDRGIYRGYVYHDVLRAGPIMNYGKLYMADYFPEPEHEVYVDQHLRTYVLFGTPDMLIRTGIPQEILVDLAYDNSSMDRYLTIRSGSGELVENALVSWTADGNRQVYLTTEDGSVPVLLTSVQDGLIHVVVTGKNLIPIQKDLLWIPPGTDGSLIITEIKPDVITELGSGDKVEIYNNDTHPIDLRGWILSDIDQFDTPFVKVEAILEPQQLAVIEFGGPSVTESVESTLYGLYIRSREIPDFSSLEDVAVLRNPHGQIVDSLAWHDNSGLGSTNVSGDLSRLTAPTSGFDVLDSGWWVGPDTIANEVYELYSVNWAPFAGNGGDGSIQRSTMGSPDSTGDFTIQSETGFGFYTHSVITKQGASRNPLKQN